MRHERRGNRAYELKKRSAEPLARRRQSFCEVCGKNKNITGGKDKTDKIDKTDKADKIDKINN